MLSLITTQLSVPLVNYHSAILGCCAVECKHRCCLPITLRRWHQQRVCTCSLPMCARLCQLEYIGSVSQCSRCLLASHLQTTWLRAAHLSFIMFMTFFLVVSQHHIMFLVFCLDPSKSLPDCDSGTPEADVWYDHEYMQLWCTCHDVFTSIGARLLRAWKISRESIITVRVAFLWKECADNKNLHRLVAFCTLSLMRMWMGWLSQLTLCTQMSQHAVLCTCRLRSIHGQYTAGHMWYTSYTTID